MPCELDPLEPPGEDTVDLAETLGWVVAACTWLRGLVHAVGGVPPGTRLRTLRQIRAESA